MKVPFLDLKAQHEPIREEIDEAIRNVVDNCAFAGGPFVEKFEEEFAFFCRGKHAVGVGSGTEALWLALLGVGVGPGDEVITVPNSFIATAEAISYCGAKPVFVDIEEQTYNINPRLIEEAITPRTKAIVPVHLFGQMADMDLVMEVAKKHGLFVVEDACQAHGAEYMNRPAGSIGDAGCFSFYPGKNLGAMGEAGAVVTNNGELAAKLRLLRDHGQEEKYKHKHIGWNARMDGIQGAILSVKLKHLRGWNEARRRHAQSYNELLMEWNGITLPMQASYGKHVYHVYAVRVKDRNALMRALGDKGIGSGIHYPGLIHMQEAYSSSGLKARRFPTAEKCATEFLSLPMFPSLGEDQILFVADEVKQFISSERS